jgi:hypothetical protein
MNTERAAAAPAKRSRFTALSVNLVVAALSIVVFLALLEIAARGFYFVRWGKLYPLQSTHYSLRLGWQLSPGQYREFGINQSGFRRASETARAPADGTIRIFLVGGSTAFGANGLYPQFPSEPLGARTIDHYLEMMLNDSLAPPVEVINAAVPEYRLFQETSLFREKLLSYSPDLLIFLDGHNDISFLTGNEIRELVAPLWSARHFKRGEQALNARSPVGALHYTDIYLGRTSYAYHLLAQLFQSVADRRGVQQDHPWGQTPFRVDDEAQLESRWASQMDSLSREYTDQVRDLAAIARHREQSILYVLQPEIVNEEPATLTDMERRIQQFAFEHHRDRGTFAWRWLGRSLPARLDSLRSPAFDVLDLGRIATPGGVQLYTDYTHLTPDGNRLVAQHMLPRVLALLAATDSVREET